VTGAGLAGMIATGAALVGGGTALLILRRRRDAIDSASDL
jgi:LPXTG-motif cell wall-anchored protein